MTQPLTLHTGAPITQFNFRALESGDNLDVQEAAQRTNISPGRLGLQPRALTVFLWHAVREVLRGRVEEQGVAQLRSSKTLVEITEEEECVRLRFDDGDEVTARVVLACDGARSACRRLLPSEPDDLLIDEGKSVWRGLAAGLDADGVSTTFKDDAGRIGLVMPAGVGQGSSWTLICDAVAGHSSSSEEARARLAAALPEELDATLRQAIDTSPIIIESKLQTRDFSKPWASAAPRVAFLGDAAHPLRPTGEGTALALEDAWTIGSLAAEAATADAFCTPATLRQYETSRRARVEAVSNAVRLVARRSYEKDAKKLINRKEISTAYEEFPIVCTPL